MSLKDRVLSERNFAATLKQVQAYRKDLLERLTETITAEPPIRNQVQVDWAIVGAIERQCALLERALEENKVLSK